MEQLESNFDHIWYLSFFEKYVEKFEFWLKSDNNNGQFT
jgi:hypothetical protein